MDDFIVYHGKPETFGVTAHEIVKSNDPETSHEAAENIDIDGQMWAVLQAVRLHGGARSHGGPGVTGDQLAIVFGPNFPYSSVKGHIVKLERQCYVERPQVKRPGELHGNNQLVIWALNYDEREERLAALAEGLNRPANDEVYALISQWVPKQEAFDIQQRELEDLKYAIIDRYLPNRPLGKWPAYLGRFTEDGILYDYTLMMEINRYSRKLRLKRRKVKPDA